MNKSRSAILFAVIPVACLGLASSAFAAEIVFPKACTFSRVKHGSFGDTTLDYRIEPGTIFQQTNKNGTLVFCGPTKMHMPPFGWGPSDECVETRNGTIVAPPNDEFTIEKTDCTADNPFSIPYRVSDFASWEGAGNAKLHGQAFLKTVGGDVKTCAGEFVYLVPSAPYFDQFVKFGAADLAQADPAAMAQLRRTVCDAQGSFSFNSIPAGNWYVLTDVTWGIPNPAAIGTNTDDPVACFGKLSRQVACAAARGLLGALFGHDSQPLTIAQGGLLLQPVELKSGDNQTWLTDRDRS